MTDLMHLALVVQSQKVEILMNVARGAIQQLWRQQVATFQVSSFLLFLLQLLFHVTMVLTADKLGLSQEEESV